MLKTLTHWLRLFGEFMVSNGIGQAAGMLAGLIYVRYMPIPEYAFYAICLSVLTFVSILSDFGLTGSTVYFWRESKKHGKAFADYLAEVRKLRFILFSICALIACIVLPLLQRGKDTPKLTLIIAIALILLAAISMISSSINLQVIRLASAFRRSYAAEIAGHIIRVLIAGLMVLGVTKSALLGLVGGAASALVIMLLSKHYEKQITDQIPAGRNVNHPRKQVLLYALPVAPMVGLFALQGSAIIWMTAAYGNNTTVAEVFALGRIGAIIGILTTFMVVVINPKLSGISDDNKFNKVSWIVRIALTFLGLGVLAFSILFPKIILWILGPNYAHLTGELVLAVLFAVIMLLTGATSLINRTRGWVRRDPLLAGIQATITILLLLNWDYAATQSVLILSCLIAASNLILFTIVSIFGIIAPQHVRIKSEV